MIHYHGAPISGGNIENAKFFTGRHAFVSFANAQPLPIVAEVCQSFALDNGAFSIWKKGGEMDYKGYVNWVDTWRRHPGFDFALIPDVIDGSEGDNDYWVQRWPDGLPGVPVWHLHESLERLSRLCRMFDRVALGSSGQWATPGTADWWQRMDEAMLEICDDLGRPPCKLHGLRMLKISVFTKLPLSSADSCNAGINAGSKDRFGMYLPPSASLRAEVIAARVESHNSAEVHYSPNRITW